MDSDVFLVSDAHVNQEFFYLFPVIAVDHQDLLGVLFVGLFLVLSPLVLALLAVLSDPTVGLEVLHKGRHTFFQNFSIFL